MTPPRPIDVLLVEDDSTAVALLTHALRRGGFSTDVAGDVAEAKRLLTRGRYKVVILDLILPDGTGFDVLEFMKAAGLLPMQIIVVTAAEPTRLAPLDRSAVKTVLFKPVDPDQLVALVGTMARGRAGHS